MAQLDVPSDWRPGGHGFNPRRGRQHSFVEIDHEIFSTLILSLPLIQEGQLLVSGERMSHLYQNCSSHLDSSKNMAARGRGLFSLYINIENFKNLLVRIPIYQDCSSHLDSSKNVAARRWGGVGGELIFPIYLYRKL